MSSHLRCRAPSLFLRVLPYALLFGLTSGCVAAADRMVDFSDSIRAMPDDAYIGGMPPPVSEVARRVRQRMQADRGGALPECRPPGPGQGLVVATDVGLVPDPSKTQTQTVLAELQSLLTSERPFVRDAAAFIVGEIGPAASSLAPDLNGHDIHRSLWFSHALGRVSCQSYAMSRTLELVPEAARVKLLGAVRGSGATHSDLRLVARLLEFPELRWPDQFFSNVIEDGNDIGRLEKEPHSGPSVRIIADHIADEALSRPLRLDLLNLLRQLGHSAKPAADTLWVLANGTDDDLAIAATSALVETGSERSVDAGKELLVRFNYGPSALPEELCSMKRAAEVLGPVLRKRLDDTSWADAAETIKMLGCIDPIGNASVARRLLTHPSWEVQLAAIEALKKSAGSDQETRTSLEAIQVSHWSGLVRKAAAEALAPPASGGPDSDSQEQFFFFKCFHRCVTDHLRQCGNDEGVVDGVYVSPTMGELTVEWERARRVRWPDHFPLTVPEDSRPDYGTSTYLRVEGGWLYGTDRWHYDGTIAFVDDQGNESPIGQWGDDAVAVLDSPDFGKTLLGSSLFSVGEAGLLASLERDAGGWKVIPRVALPSPPWGWSFAPNGTLLVADPYEAVAVLKDGSIESLACPERAPSNPKRNLRELARVAPKGLSDLKKRELADLVYVHKTEFERQLRHSERLDEDPARREKWETPEVVKSWLHTSLEKLVETYLIAGLPESGIEMISKHSDAIGEIGAGTRFHLYANAGRFVEAREQLGDPSQVVDPYALRFDAALALAERRIDVARAALDRIEASRSQRREDDHENDPYLIILRQIAGQEMKESNDMTSTHEVWPKPIQDYLAGRISEKDLTLASYRRDGQVDIEKLCEALFYKGLNLAAKGRSRAAKPYFRDVVDLGVTRFFEHAAAAYLSSRTSYSSRDDRNGDLHR